LEAITETRSTGDSTKLIAVSLGHFINDFYMEMLPPILFLFTASLSLTLTQQGLIATVITSSGSFLQPLIGFFVDKKGKSWLLIVSVIWIAFWISISGLINNYFLLLFIVGLGSVASALYHPLGSASAAKLDNNSRGKNLAIFMAIGGFAGSLPPIIVLPLVLKYGLNTLVLFIFPGLIIAGLMYALKLQHLEFDNNIPEKTAQENPTLSIFNYKWVAVLVFFATNKVLVRRSLITFGAQILLLKSVDLKTAGILLSLYMFLNSAGTILGGYFNDRVGSKKVMIIFNLLTTLSILMINFSSNLIIIVTAFIIAGLSLSGPNTSNILLAQSFLPRNVTMATGLIMGFAGGIGGMGIFVFGMLSDIFGLLLACKLLLIPLVTVNILSILLPAAGEVPN